MPVSKKNKIAVELLLHLRDQHYDVQQTSPSTLQIRVKEDGKGAPDYYQIKVSEMM